MATAGPDGLSRRANPPRSRRGDAQILPLAGDPRLVVLGKEVGLGNGYADLVAIEPSGRLVVVEIKLSRNAEARRAVVAQVLTYAAHLKGLSPEAVERDVLGRHLRDRGYENIQDAVVANDQEGSFDPAAFSEGLVECLSQGHFCLILVLDEAPQELVTLVGYLESVTDQLSIDLIAVSAYEVGGARVLVPQRVDAERSAPEPLPTKTPPGAGGHYADGAEDFAAAIDSAEEEQRRLLRRLYEWAISLDGEGFVRLGTYHAKGGDMMTLLPRLRADNAGLVTVYNDRGTASLQFWRSVFERRTPQSLPRVEQAAPVRVGQGNVAYEVSDELLEALTNAYREAASGKIGG